MQTEISHQSPVRRVDLHLRARYPDIKTIIFKVTATRFIIKCENFIGDFEELTKEFNHSIRTLGSPVEISQYTPAEYIEIIPEISDKEISKNFEGVLFNRFGLLNLLMAKFPEVHFQRIDDSAGKVSIYTESFEQIDGKSTYYKFLSKGNREKIEAFLDGLKLPIKFTLIEEEVENPRQPISDHQSFNPVQHIYATSFRRDLMPEYAVRDEALWYDNIDKIFAGDYKKQQLYFYNQDEYSCYVDYSVFENIDIRNHLFLFQTVYISLPFETNIEVWLKQRKIFKSEFLELVVKNRIKVVLVQPEFRYDIKFIQEVYEANPLAVISRRALAALQQIDIVQMSDSYLFNNLSTIKDLKPFCQFLGETTKVDPKLIYDFLVWPIRARRNSFEQLNAAGLFSTPSFGVNTAIEKQISSVLNKDLSFEFTVNASSIHLANSLNATYFPFKTDDGYSDQFYANIMGDMLNFYRNATPQAIQSYMDNRKKVSTGILQISPIDIIELNEFISITELEGVLSKDVIYPNSKRLMESLAELSEDERKRKIDVYNSEVIRNINRKRKSENIIDLGQNIMLDTIGMKTGFAFVGAVFSIFSNAAKMVSPSIKNNSFIKNLTESLSGNDHDKSNIHYLTKINRVARIKQNF